MYMFFLLAIIDFRNKYIIVIYQEGQWLRSNCLEIILLLRMVKHNQEKARTHYGYTIIIDKL